MKHIPLRCIPAALLAAALLAGCGAKTAPPASVAVKPAESKQSATLAAPVITAEPEAVPETATEAENAETPRITEQISLEKQCSAGYTTISVHLPKLESDSADAARINARLAQCYVEPCKPCLEYPALENGTPWDEVRSVGYYQYWYGDCLSLVMNVYFSADSSQKGQGFCFDFASGKELTTTQMLERMGLDPADIEQRIARQADEIFEECWQNADTGACPAKESFDRKWWSSLDQLPLSIWGDEDERNVSLGAEIYNAGEQKYVSYELTIPLYDDSVPSDWQQRVLGQWVVFRTEVDGDVCNPAEEGESYTLKLEPGASPDTVRATLTRISKYGDTTTETRTGVPTRGKIEFAFEGECWQIRCQRADDKNYEWAIALREDGTMTMADMGGNAEYSYISWMDLRRS